MIEAVIGMLTGVAGFVAAVYIAVCTWDDIFPPKEPKP